MATLPTKPQYPVNGRYKKDFKIPAGGDYGYRFHPIRKQNIHHNGVDLWGAKEPLLIEAFYDGVVTVVATNMASFGHYVVIRHNIDGKKYTSLYAHLKAPSKLKKGQKVDAGTVVGIMGATGPVTGKHLHFEIGKGATHPFIFGGDGKRYVNPMKFIAGLIKRWEAAKEVADEVVAADLPTPSTTPVQPAAAHSVAAPAVEPVEAPVTVKQPVVIKKPARKNK
jgi:murein DD-endopeptidase MepM/ murein hydrolase activator NlpD